MVIIALLGLFVLTVIVSVLLSKFAPWKFEKVRFKLTKILQSKFYKYFNYAFWVWFVACFAFPILNSPPIAFVMLGIVSLPLFSWAMSKTRDIRRKIPILR